MGNELQDLNENFDYFLDMVRDEINDFRDDNKLTHLSEDEFRALFVQVGLKDSPYLDENGMLKPMSQKNYLIVVKAAYTKVIIWLAEAMPYEGSTTIDVAEMHNKLKDVDRKQKWQELAKYFNGGG